MPCGPAQTLHVEYMKMKMNSCIQVEYTAKSEFVCIRSEYRAILWTVISVINC